MEYDMTKVLTRQENKKQNLGNVWKTNKGKKSKDNSYLLYQTNTNSIINITLKIDHHTTGGKGVIHF